MRTRHLIRSSPRLLAAVAALSLSAACTASGGNGKSDALGGVDGDASTTADGMTTDVEPEPDVASEPDVPVTPDVPVEPDIPVQPDVSEVPDVPVVPDIPTVPDTGEEPPLADQDGDQVPDVADLFPKDPNLPGTVTPGKVYAHTFNELYVMDVKTYKVTLVGKFSWPDPLAVFNTLTDIAIDRYGVLYGVGKSVIHTCHPTTAKCTEVGELPENFNAMSFVPAGVLDVDKDVLVGVSGGGTWYRLDLVQGAFVPTALGEYGDPYTSSGDVYSIAGIGTFASVNKSGDTFDWLVQVDPATGAVIKEVARLEGYSSVFGIAGWTDRAFAFDDGGAIIVVDVETGEVVKELQNTDKGWWGAGVPTVVPKD